MFRKEIGDIHYFRSSIVDNW